MPEISVILPVYNAESYIGDALASLLNQTFTDIEILVLNDGSADNSEQVILGFKDKRIRYISSKENKGLIYQLNLGVKEARGKYIARLDADDVSLPERLAVQYQFMQQNPEIVLCGSFASIIGVENGFIQYSTDDADIRLELLQHNPFVHSTVIYRKDVMDKHNLQFDEQFKHAEDYHMWVLLSQIGRLSNIPNCLVKCRMHVNQVSKIFEDVLKKHANVIRCLQASYLIKSPLSSEEEQNHLSFLFPSDYIPSVRQVYLWKNRLLVENKKMGLYTNDKFKIWLESKYETVLRVRFLWSGKKYNFADFYGSKVFLNSRLGIKERLSIIKKMLYNNALNR
jgi:glycosyltransferase involved in cell wall biosynthesis